MSAHDDTGQVAGAPHASLRDYIVGFMMSVVLTVIPFWLVMGDVLDSAYMTVFLVIAFGTVQMVVHMIYFLHLNTRSEAGWVMISLLFTVMLVVIAITGSIWIMLHLHNNTMQMMLETASEFV